jgi:hypothetical protein
MGYFFLPVVVFALFLGLTSIAREQARSAIPTANSAQTDASGQTFIAYRNAVFAYQAANPSFSGVIPNSTLSLQGTQLTASASFFASAGNAITQFGTTGRVVTAYAVLPAGAITSAMNATENDASLGIATGGTWRSFAPGATDVALPTAVPNGAVVSIIQTGK